MNNRDVLLRRYDKFFGKGSSKKILDSKKQISNDKYIRINRTNTTNSEVENFLKKNRSFYSRPFIPNALKIERSFFNLSSSLLSLTGKIYMQHYSA